MPTVDAKNGITKIEIKYLIKIEIINLLNIETIDLLK